MSTTALARRKQTLTLPLGLCIRILVSSSSGLAHFVKTFIPKLLANPQVAELLRFIFLGTVVESSRLAGQKIVDFVKHCESKFRCLAFETDIPSHCVKFLSSKLLSLAMTLLLIGLSGTWRTNKYGITHESFVSPLAILRYDSIHMALKTLQNYSKMDVHIQSTNQPRKNLYSLGGRSTGFRRSDLP